MTEAELSAAIGLVARCKRLETEFLQSHSGTRREDLLVALDALHWRLRTVYGIDLAALAGGPGRDDGLAGYHGTCRPWRADDRAQPASLLNSHCGPVRYAFELPPEARLDLKHLSEQFEIALADGLLPANESRGFKWTVDIASPSPSRAEAVGPA